MNVTCDKCQKRYSIADEKVRGKSVKIRCKNCQNLISLQGPPIAEERTVAISSTQAALLRSQARGEEALAPPAPVSAPILWFAMVDGQQVGPLDEAGLRERVQAGEITPSSYLWRQGLADWLRGHDVSELSALWAHQSSPSARSMQDVAVAPQTPAPEITANGRPQPADPSIAAASLQTDPGAPPEEEPSKPGKDPFAALGAVDPSMLPPPGEATQFFIAQAGVNKRNPPWKIGLFVTCAVVLPIALLYALSALHIVPLEVTRIDESGNEVREPVFSSKGVAGLADLLSGKNKPKAPTSKAHPADKALAARQPKKAEPANRDPSAPSAQDLAALYGDASKTTTGPRVRQDVEETSTDSASSGLSEKDVAKVVAASQSAFQQCIEQELRKNPNFKGGKVNIIAGVGSSGVVTRATIDRRDIDSSELGGCLKSRAKKMTFASFSGDTETEVHIPLILGSTM